MQTPDKLVSASSLLHDISATGVSVLVSPEAERVVFEAWEFRLTFHLPDVTGSFDLHGHVRFRKPRLDVPAIFYGVEFDRELSPDFDRQQKRIHAFVMRRQADTLRAAEEAAREG